MNVCSQTSGPKSNQAKPLEVSLLIQKEEDKEGAMKLSDPEIPKERHKHPSG